MLLVPPGRSNGPDALKTNADESSDYDHQGDLEVEQTSETEGELIEDIVGGQKESEI